MDNSDGKASLKRQKSPETTTDTQGMSKFYWFYETWLTGKVSSSVRLYRKLPVFLRNSVCEMINQNYQLLKIL